MTSLVVVVHPSGVTSRLLSSKDGMKAPGGDLTTSEGMKGRNAAISLIEGLRRPRDRPPEVSPGEIPEGMAT